MTGSSFLSVIGRMCARALCIFVLVSVSQVVSADTCPQVQSGGESVELAQSDPLRVVRHWERLERITMATLQKMSERISSKDGRMMRQIEMAVAVLLYLASLWIGKNTGSDTGAAPQESNANGETAPSIDIGTDGLSGKSKRLLALLLIILVGTVGTALLMLCSSECISLFFIKDRIALRGLDPMEEFQDDLIWNGLGMVVGLILLVGAFAYAFRLRRTLRRSDEADKQPTDTNEDCITEGSEQ